jgi:uncharacterized membrane protein YqjE
MAFQTRDPAGHGGLIGALLALLTDFVALAESRLALLVRESKLALVQIMVLAGCLLAAILLFTLGYIFLVVSAVFGVAHLVQTSWIWIALIAANVHFLLAVAALLIARARMLKAPFPELSAELKKDRQWLKNLDVSSRPAN